MTDHGAAPPSLPTGYGDAPRPPSVHSGGLVVWAVLLAGLLGAGCCCCVQGLLPGLLGLAVVAFGLLHTPPTRTVRSAAGVSAIRR